MTRYRAVIELAVAFAALVGGLVSWSRSHHPTAIAPIADGQPFTSSTVFDPQLLLLTLILLTTAGVLAVVGTARLRRARAGAKPSA